jgi:hypothetical protein
MIRGATEMAKKKQAPSQEEERVPNYEIHIQELPERGHVQLVIQVNQDIKDRDFFVLFGLIEEYNMIISIKEIIEARYDNMGKMHLKELYYPRQGTFACVTIIEDFDKAFIHYLKLYFKNKLIYAIGKKDKELQKKAERHIESIEFVISELVDNAFTYPFERYLKNHEELSQKLQSVPLLEKYKRVKKTDKDYHFNATIFFEAKLMNQDKELAIQISNEAEISKTTLDFINNRINNDAYLPEIIEDHMFTNPFKETSGLGLSMAKAIIENLNGKIAGHYDEVMGRFIVEFSISLEDGEADAGPREPAQ